MKLSKRSRIADNKMMQWQKRILSAPLVYHGQVCIKGTRIILSTRA
ncbi:MULTISPECIES: hypothetical protein [unclassified Microcystis]|nr:MULTISPECIES: hypothetical protein [unclassified Microcystis]MCA2763993.1 hypothetical protein [Microcystis sp. M151S2]MCA2643767.1 hypothetical protein [Microcystis sp. M087S2]MCA2671743.1 hypothetical protein [Microcystis sp. M080S2]MCA2688390.1 hypothetical protein [Microcystis sp. M037S2]MCA2732849.1 hypothetical protein [Microcystis sp. M158S2]